MKTTGTATVKGQTYNVRFQHTGGTDWEFKVLDAETGKLYGTLLRNGQHWYWDRCDGRAKARVGYKARATALKHLLGAPRK